jgi:DNA-binding MarR family transcriptional regulator
MATYNESVNPLSSDDLAVWHACKTVGDTVMRRIGADLTAATGLSAADWGVISRLEDLGHGSLGQQELAESMSLSKGAMSNQLSRMTQRGLVRREKSGRAVTVTLTDQGRAALLRARPVHAQALRTHLLDRLSRADRDLLLRISGLISGPA